jgi:hypothetical protein
VTGLVGLTPRLHLPPPCYSFSPSCLLDEGKARWIAQPTWYVYPLAILGAFVLMFGAIYADTYLLHRRDITSNRLRRDTVIAIVATAGTVWSFLRRHRSKRQLS